MNNTPDVVPQDKLFVLYKSVSRYLQPLYSSHKFTDINIFLRKMFIESDCSDEKAFYSGFIVKQSTKQLFDKLVFSEDVYDRKEAAMAGYKLDILINDIDWRVRWEVANHGYGLDKLVNDENVDVRCIAAWKGNAVILDKLMNDESDVVRAVVASRGYKSDFFMNDPSEKVRSTAREHYKLFKAANNCTVLV